jgi:hypothetical protein
MSPFRKRLSRPVNGYGLVAVFASSVGLVIASLLISLHVAHDSASQFCDIVVASTDAYRETPPKTAAGRNVARRMEALRDRLGCPIEKD